MNLKRATRGRRNWRAGEFHDPVFVEQSPFIKTWISMADRRGAHFERPSMGAGLSQRAPIVARQTTAPNSANPAPERVFIRCAVSCNAGNGLRDNHSLPTPIAKQTIADPCWRAGRLSRLLAGLVGARAAVGSRRAAVGLWPVKVRSLSSTERRGQDVRCCRVIRYGGGPLKSIAHCFFVMATRRRGSFCLIFTQGSPVLFHRLTCRWVEGSLLPGHGLWRESLGGR